MTLDLTSPDAFKDGQFWHMLDWLRANEPVSRQFDESGRPFWALTRYKDIQEVYGQHQLYTSGQGMRLGAEQAAVAAVSQKMLIVSDAPAHTRLKRVLSQAFTGSSVRQLEGSILGVTRMLLQEARDKGSLDFLDISRRLPNYVVCALLGLPFSSWDTIGRLTTAAFEGSQTERSEANAEIFLYFAELVEERRARPGDDLVSTLLHYSSEAASGMSDEELVYNLNGVLSGANETTRYATAGAVEALARFPDQWTALRAGGIDVVDLAVEEVLRWTVPGMHALRTASTALTIGGVELEAGARVTLWNGAANRDPSVFERPYDFELTRTPNRHLTFGAGRHVCLGARLARLELRIFLAELASMLRVISVDEEPVYNGSNFTWGLSRLDVTLS